MILSSIFLLALTNLSVGVLASTPLNATKPNCADSPIISEAAWDPNLGSESPQVTHLRTIGAVCGNSNAAYHHITVEFTPMSSHPRREHTAAHGPANNHQLLVDGRTASDSASDVGDNRPKQNSMANRSLIWAAGNEVASRVEICPQANTDPLAEMLTLMREQATRIQNLEQNLDRMKEADRKRCRERHRRHHNRSPNHHGAWSPRERSRSTERRCRGNSLLGSTAHSRREPRVGSVHRRIEHFESRTRLRYEDMHARCGSEWYEDPEDGDDTPSSDFIM